MVSTTQSKKIIVNNLSYKIDGTAVNFVDINLAFTNKKYAIVGDNGIGKTTLLKLIAGSLAPDSGSVQRNGSLYQLPQQHSSYAEASTIADVLEIANIIHAMENINQGSCSEDNFAFVEGNWDIKQRVDAALQKYQLIDIDIKQKFSALSGGQKTKLLLAKIEIFAADFLLLDEPTNNLDQDARSVLYDYVKNSDQAIIIISHDRSLLNQVDCILELTTKGISEYGGNYDFYLAEKTLQQNALDRQYQAAKGEDEKTKRSIQSTRERHEKSAGRGKDTFKQGRVDKITADSRKGRSEKTKSRMTTLEDKMNQQRSTKLQQIKDQIEYSSVLDVSLDATSVPNGKQVLAIENLCFHYADEKKQVIKNFSLALSGPRRIALVGANGCGKTTLIQLILGKLKPGSGEIKIGVDTVCYLDQQVSFLDPGLTVLDNFLKNNNDATEFAAYSALAKFKFRNKDALKLASQLSGGEKMRAGLAISLMAKTPPQLLILDEPTNHLDLKSIQAIESALAAFKGALIVVSHDESFLSNIGVEKILLC